MDYSKGEFKNDTRLLIQIIIIMKFSPSSKNPQISLYIRHGKWLTHIAKTIHSAKALPPVP